MCELYPPPNIGCSSSSCIIQAGSAGRGMVTNGACKCHKNPSMLKKALAWYKQRLAEEINNEH